MMKNQHRLSRKRGSLLADALLSIGIIMMIVVMFAANNQREAQSQQDRMTASRTEAIANAAKSYVGEQYNTIRENLISSGGEASTILTLADLSDNGYLSSSMLSGAAGNVFSQDYRLFIRGVRRGDTSWPQSTLTAGDIASLNSPDANGVPRLINGLYSNTDDEMDLEAVLISEGGTEIPRKRGSNITGFSGNPTMGYVRPDPDTGELVATGNLGSFQMPLAPWQAMGANTGEGHLLTLISLSDGVPGGNGGNANIRGALQRCFDLASDAEREACLQDGNKMYSNVVFSTISGSNPAYDDYPGIEGLKKIACREPDSASRPTGNMDASSDMIYVDCGDVIISDNLSIQNGDLNVQEGDVNVQNGTITLNGNEISNNLIMAYGEGLNGNVLPASPITEVCPLRPDGTRMTYKVQAWVTDMIEPVGRAMSGHRTSWRSASSPRGMSLSSNPDPTTGQFVIDVVSFVHEDFCSNVSGSSLTPNNAAGGMTQSDFTKQGSDWIYNGPMCGSTNGDGYPDAYLLNDNQAKVQYAVYCE